MCVTGNCLNPCGTDHMFSSAGAGHSVQFRQLQLYRHEMQHFVKVIQGYIANQILQVSWSEFTAKLATASDLDAIHRTHADYLNRAIFRCRPELYLCLLKCFNTVNLLWRHGDIFFSITFYSLVWNIFSLPLNAIFFLNFPAFWAIIARVE